MSRTKIQRTKDLTTFICANCGRTVAPPAFGTEQRNHCPHCLFSLHVDLRIGDRRSGCRGKMAPIGVWVKNNKEWAIIHRCTKCGFIRTNRIAGDDAEQVLLALAVKPLTKLPFPMEEVG
ncbi:MAG: RNHCP domain-containing protein [Spirochaetales bacterium]|nr:RNHCP domain-containing protein [Spirochaetales bacterium]